MHAFESLAYKGQNKHLDMILAHKKNSKLIAVKIYGKSIKFHKIGIM